MPEFFTKKDDLIVFHAGAFAFEEGLHGFWCIEVHSSCELSVAVDDAVSGDIVLPE